MVIIAIRFSIRCPVSDLLRRSAYAYQRETA